MNNIFNKPILIYSNYCNYSKQFLNILSQTPIVNNFVFVSVDIDQKTLKRSNDFLNLKIILKQQYNYNLNTVPTIIIEGGELILSSNEAFEWLRYSINTINNSKKTTENPPTQQIEKKQTNNDTIIGINHNEMFSFSDTYSSFGNNEQVPTQQSFQFLSHNELIDTPSDSGGNFKKKNVKFEFDVPEQIVDNKFKPDSTGKEKELNQKYEQLMMERKTMDKNFNSIERK